MTLHPLKPRQALNKAYLKVKPTRSEIDLFKAQLTTLLKRTNATESEEFHKNLLADFLKKTYYAPAHYINTKGRTDLVIHTGDKAKSPVGVLIEAKKPTNAAEMLRPDKLNTKALHELLLYYLRERISHKNKDLKHLLATNLHEWFIFDAHEFEKHFADSKKLVKQFTDFEAGRLAGKTTDFFYREIAEPFVAQLPEPLTFTYFKLSDYKKPLESAADNRKLIALYKLLSPEHLLKLPFSNDSNSLDKKFYSELLHIIGLTETKEKGKKVITRKPEGQRNPGSLLEGAIEQLDQLNKLYYMPDAARFGETKNERQFNAALELSITWVNRILFLKTA